MARTIMNQNKFREEGLKRELKSVKSAKSRVDLIRGNSREQYMNGLMASANGAYGSLITAELALERELERYEDGKLRKLWKKLKKWVTRTITRIATH